MAFEWLKKFHHEMEKGPDYAEKTLAAYRLGIKAKGAIVGVVIQPSAKCCEAARHLAEGKVYDPDSAPRLPLPGCPREYYCSCVYRPVMSYQRTDER